VIYVPLYENGMLIVVSLELSVTCGPDQSQEHT